MRKKIIVFKKLLLYIFVLILRKSSRDSKVTQIGETKFNLMEPELNAGIIVFEAPVDIKGILDNECLFFIISMVYIHYKKCLK